jgi:hypothetical protein
LGHSFSEALGFTARLRDELRIFSLATLITVTPLKPLKGKKGKHDKVQQEPKEEKPSVAKQELPPVSGGIF